MGLPQVSVVLPVWNGERFLRTAVRSILDQDFKDFELIVIDDGSTDGTRDVLRAAGEEGLAVAVFLAERNGGKGSAIRRGLTAATGTIIAIQDADLELCKKPSPMKRVRKPMGEEGSETADS